MRIAIMSFFFLFGVFKASAQDADGWALLQQENGVNVYAKEADCDLSRGYDERRVLLRFENTNKSSKAIVSYHADLSYNNDCITCNDPHGEYQYIFSLRSGESIEGECTITTPKHLFFFIRWVSRPNEVELTDYVLNNISVDLFEIKE